MGQRLSNSGGDEARKRASADAKSGGSDHGFEFIPAPEALAPYLNSLYVLRIGPGGLDEMLPAYSGQLLVSNGASGWIDFGQGFVEAPPNAAVVGPLSHAYPLKIDGPATLLGASMSFYGWSALTRLPATQFGDQFIEPAIALGEETGEEIAALASDLGAGSIDTGKGLDRLAALLQPRAIPLPDQHRELIDKTYAWISGSFNPSAADLYASLPVSERQAQRLVKRFFGLSPMRLRRRYRAIRAATLLGNPNLDPATRADLLNSFYDQAHMIREIREFTGATPRLFSKGNSSVIHESLREDGYGVVDVFAGNEAEQLSRHKD